MDDSGRASALRGGARQGLFVFVFLVIHVMAARNVYYLGTDLALGSGVGGETIPLPRYDFMRVPSNPLTRAHDGAQRLAADFAQVYFPSQFFERTADAYRDGVLDPWGRPSRYAPLVHAVASATFARLSYGPASLLHLALQYGLLLASLVFAFRRWKLRGLWPTLLLFHGCLFVSPVGLAALERGQFTLYVALALLWTTLGIVERKAAWIAVGALFAYFKWTSFPFLFVVLGLWFGTSGSRAERKARLPLLCVAPVVVVALFALHWQLGWEFLAGIKEQELAFRPEGVSLARLLPRALVKALPFMALAYGCFRYRRVQRFVDCAPYLAVTSVLLLTYPTLAFDYSAPCLFGLAPLLVRWRGSSQHLALFAGFAVLASYSFGAPWLSNDKATLAGYLLGAAVLFWYTVRVRA